MGYTLIIPTRDRRDLLGRSLDFLQRVTWPNEVIVVDDGGTDDTADVCRHFGARYRHLDRPGDTNSAAARNVGLEMASNEDIIVSDPEVAFVTDVVARMCAAREEGHAHEVLHPARGLKQRPNGEFDPTRHGWFFLNCFRRSWAVDVGGWDESFPEPWGWEDIDFYERLEATGHGKAPVVGCEVAHMWHPSRSTTAPLNEARVRRLQALRDSGAGGIIANGGFPHGLH